MWERGAGAHSLPLNSHSAHAYHMTTVQHRPVLSDLVIAAALRLHGIVTTGGSGGCLLSPTG